MAKKKRIQPCEPLARWLEINGKSAADLARELDMPPSTVRSLVNGWRPVTAEMSVYIERKIGVSRDTLRPDIFVKRAA